MSYAMLKKRYREGRITKEMLKRYVITGHITAEEYEKITGEPYEEEV